MNVSSQPKIVFHEKFPYVTHDAVSVMSQYVQIKDIKNHYSVWSNTRLSVEYELLDSIYL